MDTQVEEKDGNILSKINQGLRNIFLPGIKLEPQEETIANIIYKILEAPGTQKITPGTGNCYLINAKLHYYVKISPVRIYIINSVDSVVRDCRETFTSFLCKIIYNAVDKDVEVLEDTLFRNEIKLLEKIESKVNE